MYFGKTNYSSPTGSIETTGAQALATATYLERDGFNAFVKAGAIREYTKVNDTVSTPVKGVNTKVVKWIPAAVIGIGYMPTQNFNILLQYERTFGANWDSSSTIKNVDKPMTQNAVMLGLSYKFAI